MSFILYDKTIHAAQVHTVPAGEPVPAAFVGREREGRYKVDGVEQNAAGLLPSHIVELEITQQPFPEVIADTERAAPTRVLDLTAKTLVRGWALSVYTPTAEEQAEATEREQTLTLLATCADMRNHVGTAVERITRLENFVGRLGPRLVKKGVLP